MAGNTQRNVLFHLMPLNDIARETAKLPENRCFVAQSPMGGPAFEVGFHVSPAPGCVLARIGRHGELVLPKESISGVHVTFEMHPESLVLLLSVRSSKKSSVTVASSHGVVEGDCVLGYGKSYDIDVAGYQFRVLWRQGSPESIRELAVQEYPNALLQQVGRDTAELPIETGSVVAKLADPLARV